MKNSLIREIFNYYRYVDFVNLMSYDYHSYVWYYPLTGLNSPLFPRSTEKGFLASLNVNYSSNYWIMKGMPKEKIIIGIPTYGHSYKLTNPRNHDVEAPAKGIGSLGEDSFVPYYTVCQFLQGGANFKFLNDSLVPYAYKNDEWISYDNIDSVIQKVSIFIIYYSQLANVTKRILFNSLFLCKLQKIFIFKSECFQYFHSQN